MKYEDYKTKAEDWDYYQELLKQNGFAGITDLLTKYKQLEKVQPSPAVAVPDGWQMRKNDSGAIILERLTVHGTVQNSSGFSKHSSSVLNSKLFDFFEAMLSTPTPPSAEQSNAEGGE